MNNALDISGMAQEVQNIMSEKKSLLSEKDIQMVTPPPKLDSKGRLYGTIVSCTRCGARNVTLYNNANGAKFCKKCKMKMEGAKK